MRHGVAGRGHQQQVPKAGSGDLYCYYHYYIFERTAPIGAQLTYINTVLKPDWVMSCTDQRLLWL
jgi:hypothetical protein